MKKRKELDALLLTNMNGKKSGKQSTGKEAHELLRNEASWDTNSTENDDFFSPPRKLMIRKPQKWRCCTTCIPMCVFVVMVACIVVTGGLIWMHLDLKQDLDELRLRIAKVESSLETSSDQASTVSTLQLKIEQLQKLPTQLASLNRQIDDMQLVNDQLQAKVQSTKDDIENMPTVNVENLSQTTAQIGSKVQSMQGLQSEHSETMKTMTASIDLLQTSLTKLQEHISDLHATTPAPPADSLVPGSDREPGNPTTSSPVGPVLVGKTLQALQRRLDDVSSAVDNNNSTVKSLQAWRNDITPRISTLESAEPTMIEKVASIQTQVNSLINGHHNGSFIPGVDSQTTDSIGTEGQGTLTEDIESRLQTIQSRLDELNPADLNNNLLNDNVTRGLQHMIERALGRFKEDNLKSYEELQTDNQALWDRLYQQHMDIEGMQTRLGGVETRLAALENGTAQTSEIVTKEIAQHSTLNSAPSKSGETLPVVIPGITTVKELQVQFFIWDADNDGLVTYSDIRQSLNDATPAQSQLMQFDVDANKKLNLSEMISALGLHK